MRKPRVIALLFAVSGAGCVAQATDEYKGEPLLSLHGQATVNVSTGGLPVLPALCFDRHSNQVDYVEPEELPMEVADLVKESLMAPQDDIAILELDSVGQFPADFNVVVYTPPPAAAIKPLFSGEPPSATASVCAVRANHADVVARPLLSLQGCDPDQAPCERHAVWVFRDSQRYYAEVYDCPDGNSTKEECALSTRGDASVKREFNEDVLGWDAARVVYLAEAAPAGSYTAWKYGARDGLSAGYHLFATTPLSLQTDEALQCIRDAQQRAAADVLPQFQDHVVTDGFTRIDNANVDAYQEAVDRRFAHYRMLNCSLPDTHELSPEDALSITINRDTAWDPFEVKYIPPFMSHSGA